METTPANGHHKTTPVPSLKLLPQPVTGLRYELILQLVREAVEQEVRLKETLKKLDAEIKEVGHQDLPSVLMALMRTPSEQHEASGRPTVAPTEPPPPAMNGVMKAKIMGLMSDKKEWRAGNIIARLKLHPNSAYTVLNLLVKEGHLKKTRYAHYRLKLRA
jgi:hypothetical protein